MPYSEQTERSAGAPGASPHLPASDADHRPLPHRAAEAGIEAIQTQLGGLMRGGTAARLALAGLGAALLAGCGGPSILEPAGPIAAQNKQILVNSAVIMLAIGIPTILATIGFAWWFRHNNSAAKYDPDFVYSGRVEMIVWSIPTIVILFLGGVIWIGSHELDPRKPLPSKVPPLEVQVVSLDWKWLFIYPQQGVASVNELVVPAGVPVHLSLTSASVMNVFFVPRVGSMIYTMNGMKTDLNLQVDKLGSYYGQSAQLSGDGFSDMNFQMKAVPPAQFGAWAAAAKGTGPVLDGRGYLQLAQQSDNVRPYSYRAVHPKLFEAIVTQKLPQAPGPKTGRGGHHEIIQRQPRQEH
jgi:cytochrome o ubiquinol oxidase subunit 2